MGQSKSRSRKRRDIGSTTGKHWPSSQSTKAEAKNELEASNLSASGRKLLVQALNTDECTPIGDENSSISGKGNVDESSDINLSLSTSDRRSRGPSQGLVPIVHSSANDGSDGSDGSSSRLGSESLRTKLSNDSPSSVYALKAKLLRLQSSPGNEICADCPAPSSTWASTTFGVFVCANCAGAHRSLGAHVSFMQSITLDLDNWKPEWTERLEMIGNARSNAKLEFYVPPSWPKPGNETPGSYLREYIKAKYDDQLFSRDHNADKAAGLDPVPWAERTTRLTRASNSMGVGRIEYVGIVSVRVLKAEHLTPMPGAIPLAPAPAFYTNPYCVVRLGPHEARTKTINRTLNPDWNEGPPENVRFSMSWNGVALLEVSVWNHEKIGKDKIIGSALVDINQLKVDASAIDSLINQSTQPTGMRSVCVKLFEYRPQAAQESSFNDLLDEDGASSSSNLDSYSQLYSDQRSKEYLSAHLVNSQPLSRHSSSNSSSNSSSSSSSGSNSNLNINSNNGKLPPHHRAELTFSSHLQTMRGSIDTMAPFMSGRASNASESDEASLMSLEQDLPAPYQQVLKERLHTDLLTQFREARDHEATQDENGLITQNSDMLLVLESEQRHLRAELEEQEEELRGLDQEVQEELELVREALENTIVPGFQRCEEMRNDIVKYAEALSQLQQEVELVVPEVVAESIEDLMKRVDSMSKDTERRVASALRNVLQKKKQAFSARYVPAWLRSRLLRRNSDSSVTNSLANDQASHSGLGASNNDDSPPDAESLGKSDPEEEDESGAFDLLDKEDFGDENRTNRPMDRLNTDPIDREVSPALSLLTSHRHGFSSHTSLASSLRLGSIDTSDADEEPMILQSPVNSSSTSKARYRNASSSILQSMSSVVQRCTSLIAWVLQLGIVGAILAFILASLLVSQESDE
mmetsp:Transcript_8885/g.17545  ORF Transcript_8885/g.17545 Transcript_8885/m.17545 type:complete len:921 (-) Transcript_8885:253-3015(-)